jgi:hypothetical protein
LLGFMFAGYFETPLWLMAVLPGLVSLVLVGLWSFVVGTIRERAGLPATSLVRPVLGGLAGAGMAVGFCLSCIWLLMVAQVSPAAVWTTESVVRLILLTLATGAAGFVCGLAAAIGLRSAEVNAQNRIAEGRWEVTTPIRRPQEPT